MKKMSKGFTLVELLVSIAIIAILTGIVFSATERSRSRARDARRVSDIAQIQVALEAYYDQTPVGNRSYPTAISDLVNANFLPSTPSDPKGGAYSYNRVAQTSYCLGASLENNNLALAQSSTTCVLSGLSGSYQYKVGR
jgi:prepilin-type N-terminal cleavage/methylation domain-containing protein